jgi:hypothetical protein
MNVCRFDYEPSRFSVQGSVFADTKSVMSVQGSFLAHWWQWVPSFSRQELVSSLLSANCQLLKTLVGTAWNTLPMVFCYQRTFLGKVQELNSWPLECAAVDVTQQHCASHCYVCSLRCCLEGTQCDPYSHKGCIQPCHGMQLLLSTGSVDAKKLTVNLEIM